MRYLICLSISLFSVCAHGFEIFKKETVVMATSCVSGNCSNSRWTYSIKDKRVIEKIELLDQKGNVLRATLSFNDDCEIKDDKNWICNVSMRAKSPDFMFSVIDGRFYPQPSSMNVISWRQVK